MKIFVLAIFVITIFSGSLAAQISAWERRLENDPDNLGLLLNFG